MRYDAIIKLKFGCVWPQHASVFSLSFRYVPLSRNCSLSLSLSLALSRSLIVVAHLLHTYGNQTKRKIELS